MDRDVVDWHLSSEQTHCANSLNRRLDSALKVYRSVRRYNPPPGCLGAKVMVRLKDRGSNTRVRPHGPAPFQHDRGAAQATRTVNCAWRSRPSALLQWIIYGVQGCPPLGGEADM